MKFCFFGNVSDALRGNTPGGGELQIALLAKALARQGHEVVIVDPLARESFSTAEGVQLVHVPGWNKGLKGIRLFTNRIPSLRKVLIGQNADYYYVRMRSYLHLIPYLAARKTKKKFMTSIACDLDVLSFGKKYEYEYRPKFNLFQFLTLYVPNDLVFSHLLNKSDFLILQHMGQKPKSVPDKVQVSVYPNIFDQANVPVIENPSRDYFIYVGSLTMLKGADKLYELIRSADKKNLFVIVGKPKDRRSNEIYDQLAQMENVILKGSVNHHETVRLIGNARAVINTSYYEGFPNIFLEAWATGVPVISLQVNPGNVINQYHLGICCDGNLDRMRIAMESGETCSIDKSRLRAYVSEFHDLATAADRFLKLIQPTNNNN